MVKDRQVSDRELLSIIQSEGGTTVTGAIADQVPIRLAGIHPRLQYLVSNGYLDQGQKGKHNTWTLTEKGREYLSAPENEVDANPTRTEPAQRMTDLDFLTIIAEAEGEHVPSTTIVEASSIIRTGVIKRLNKLAEKGLVEKKTTRPGKSNLWALTDEGKAELGREAEAPE